MIYLWILIIYFYTKVFPKLYILPIIFYLKIEPLIAALNAPILVRPPKLITSSVDSGHWASRYSREESLQPIFAPHPWRSCKVNYAICYVLCEHGNIHWEWKKDWRCCVVIVCNIVPTTTTTQIKHVNP